MPKHNISDRWLQSKKTTAGDYWDAGFPGFGVRVSDTGRKTFVLAARYSVGSSPARRALGQYPKITLEKARQRARDWLEQIRQGVDPAKAEERARDAVALRAAMTFAAVAEKFIAGKLPAERKGREVAQDIRREFIPAWGKMPITEVTDLDVLGVINAKKRTAPAQARNLLGVAKRLFAWAVDQRTFGLKVSPADGLKPTKLIGEKVSGDRTLTDVEIFALWRATRHLATPHRAVYRLLMLTALRLNEAADAAWPEFDLKDRTWTIPAARMKGKNSKAREHVVPLTDDVLAILEELPTFKKGPFLFSTTFGVSPVWMSDKIKKRLDARMLRTLRALARRRGEDPATVKLGRWTNHDIRRTVRSGLSRLKVTEEAREALLAHAMPGVRGIYNKYKYLDEKREALELWGARLRSIVEPAPPNVVPLHANAR